MQNFSHNRDDPLFALGRAILFRLDPERAHDLALAFLDRSPVRRLISHRYRTDNACVTCLGTEFSNRLGLAAGLDKNGDYIDALGALGFGHIEIGTITPKPQSGNDKPRLFRLTEHESLINRMGFNNKGVDHMIERIPKRRYSGILGINIGKNASTPLEKSQEDYLYCLERVYPLADYITVNISSPNTPGLRDLQHGTHLKNLLGAIQNCRIRLSSQHQQNVPVVVKLAPDLSSQEIASICEEALAHDIDGIILGNTTQQREGIHSHRHARETGGLSGKALRSFSNDRLKVVKQHIGKQRALIGAGGVSCGQDAIDKIDLGADLVQLYSGLIFQGPGLVQDCIRATSDMTTRAEHSN